MTPERLAEIKAKLIADVSEYGNEALVIELVTEVTRLSAFEATMKEAWKKRFEWKTIITSEDEDE